jgi:ribosomal protein L44E
MHEHYPKATIEVSVWCNRCGKFTMHRVDDGRRGPCLDCMAEQEHESEMRKRAQAHCPKQRSLFQ